MMPLFCRAALAALLVLGACGGPGEETGQPDDATVSHRVVEHFRKTVTTPGLTFRVLRLADAEIPGWRKGALQVALGDQTEDVIFYVTRDGRWLFRGNAVDLTVDPLLDIQRRIAVTGEPARGPANAPVTLVEYSDFQCPFCARLYETLERDVLPRYGDRVRFVYKHQPLSNIHPWAEDAAIAAECAGRQGPDRFWAMYRGLFERQKDLTVDNLPTQVADIGRAAGMDTGQLSACVAARETRDQVRAEAAEADALGVTSTPTFFVNGRRLTGAQTAEVLRGLIDEELAAASR